MALSIDNKQSIYILCKVGFKQNYLASKYGVTPAYVSTLVKKMEEEEKFYKGVDEIIERMTNWIEDQVQKLESETEE